MKNSALWVVLAVLVLGGFAWYLTRPFDFAAFESGRGPCPGKRVKFKVQDPQMSEYVAEGTEVEVVMNWFACNPPKHGDIVLYRYSREHSPVVKRVVAGPGDKFAVLPGAKASGWNLKVNDEYIEWNGGPYFFGAASTPPPLKLAEAQMRGVLSTNAAIIFSGHPPGLHDSALFGPVQVGELIGKIDLPGAVAPKTESKTETE